MSFADLQSEYKKAIDNAAEYFAHIAAEKSQQHLPYMVSPSEQQANSLAKDDVADVNAGMQSMVITEDSPGADSSYDHRRRLPVLVSNWLESLKCNLYAQWIKLISIRMILCVSISGTGIDFGGWERSRSLNYVAVL